MKTVYILRGPSGSGKSTWITQTIPNAVICSADQFFMENGDYNFDPVKLPMAHAYCLDTFLTALYQNVKEVVVDNTNIRAWEYSHYVKIAHLMGYDVQVIEFVADNLEDVRACATRNAHGVPANVVCQQALNFEPTPDHLNITRMSTNAKS